MAKMSAKGAIIKHATTATPTVELTQVRSISFNQGDREQIDTTTHDSTTTKEHVDSKLRETPTLEMTLVYDPANVGHEAVRAAHAAGTLYYITLVLPDAGAAQWAMSGYVTAFNLPSLATNAALDQIELDSGIGSPTLGKRLGIPGLRTWRVSKFPLLWCYFERGDHLDVVRLLGERQDIAAILGDEFASN